MPPTKEILNVLPDSATGLVVERVSILAKNRANQASSHYLEYT